MAPIVVNGKALSADDMQSLIQHVDMLKAAALHSGDSYMTHMLSTVIEVLTIVRNERAN